MVVPLLYGQPDIFIQWQLVYFRTETRKDPVMTALAAALTDSDIRNLGAYLVFTAPCPLRPPPRTIGRS